MTGRRTYTEQQKTEALALYVEVGPAEAERQTGIPKKTIASWGSLAGLQTDVVANTRAATEAAAEVAKLKRERLRVLLLDKAVDMLERMDVPHKDFKGKDADEVWWDKAPSGSCQQYATTAAILIDKLRLEEGSATSRDEVITPDERRERVAERLDELAARRPQAATG